MELALVFQKLAIALVPGDREVNPVALALGLGLLVGLQRERVHSELAGIRTFGLITVFGAVSALLGETFGGWVVGFGAAGLAALLVIGKWLQNRGEESDPGLTTEVAVLLMYGVGAYLVVGANSVAIAVGGGVALLLHFKEPMHAFVARIGESDLLAIMQFVLIALVILPVLPDQAYGPYEVLNPREIWLMVVLIVGINLGGYVAYKLFSHHVGALLAGVLGGMISSTATTVSYARSTMNGGNVLLAAVVLIIATTVSLVRILAEVAVAAPACFGQMAPPLSVMLGWMIVLSAAAYLLGRGSSAEQPLQENPAQLVPALVFGGLYALMLLAIAAAKQFFGDAGLYGVAILSGLHDVDAITLSTSRLVSHGQVEADLGWRAILSAFLANVVAKQGIVWLLGHRQLALLNLALSGAAMAGGIAILLLWPEIR